MRKGPAIAVTSIVAVGLAVGGAVAGGVTLESLAHWGQPRNVVEIDGQTVPLPSPDKSPTRLLDPIVTADEGAHAFSRYWGGEPVLHDPCRAVTWRISTDGLPEGAEGVIVEAVESIQEHTGLAWERVESMADPVDPNHPILARDSDGWDYAPVEIGFVTGQSMGLGDDSVGEGGAFISPGAYGDGEFLRSGVVLVDPAQLSGDQGTEQWVDSLRTVLLHELGHVVGLDHVADPDQVMFPAFSSRPEWSAGDSEGLAAAGKGRCEGAA